MVLSVRSRSVCSRRGERFETRLGEGSVFEVGFWGEGFVRRGKSGMRRVMVPGLPTS